MIPLNYLYNLLNYAITTLFRFRTCLFCPTTLNKNMNATCKVLVPCFMSWNNRSQKCSICTKILFLTNDVHKIIYIPVIEHFSIAKIIHPPDRCGISRWCLNSTIIKQVHLVLVKKSAVLLHNTMPQTSQILRERAMLTAGMSTKAVARKLNVHKPPPTSF